MLSSRVCRNVKLLPQLCRQLQVDDFTDPTLLRQHLANQECKDVWHLQEFTQLVQVHLAEKESFRLREFLVTKNRDSLTQKVRLLQDVAKLVFTGVLPKKNREQIDYELACLTAMRLMKHLVHSFMIPDIVKRLALNQFGYDHLDVYDQHYYDDSEVRPIVAPLMEIVAEVPLCKDVAGRKILGATRSGQKRKGLARRIPDVRVAGPVQKPIAGYYVCLSNLPKNVKEDQLREWFRAYGPLKSVQIFEERQVYTQKLSSTPQKGRSNLGSALVAFESPAAYFLATRPLVRTFGILGDAFKIQVDDSFFRRTLVVSGLPWHVPLEVILGRLLEALGPELAQELDVLNAGAIEYLGGTIQAPPSQVLGESMNNRLHNDGLLVLRFSDFPGVVRALEALWNLEIGDRLVRVSLSSKPAKPICQHDKTRYVDYPLSGVSQTYDQADAFDLYGVPLEDYLDFRAQLSTEYGEEIANLKERILNSMAAPLAKPKTKQTGKAP